MPKDLREAMQQAVNEGSAGDCMNDMSKEDNRVAHNVVNAIHVVDEAKRLASGLNDTGARVDAPSGATREPTTGKGMYHLITPVIAGIAGNIEDYNFEDSGFNSDIANQYLKNAIEYAYQWLGNKDTIYLEWAINEVIFACAQDSESNGYANALMRLAKHYERGAYKYDQRNWEKGLSSSRCFDSAIRHMVRQIAGDRTEDHLAAAIWNLMGIKHYLYFEYYKDIPGVLDLDMPWRGTQIEILPEEKEF